jgi:hypothetical protein
MGNWLGIAGLLVAVATLGLWARALVAVRVPARQGSYKAAAATAVVLGVGSLLLGNDGFAGTAATIALVTAGSYLVLAAVSGQDRREPTVAVGQPILDFQAPDDNGDAFDLSTLRGRPFLLKFFRGHW